MKRFKWFLAAIVLLAMFLSLSCTFVKPYERGALADPIMIFDYYELDTAYCQKMLETREGAVGGYGGASGGCGCK